MLGLFAGKVKAHKAQETMVKNAKSVVIEGTGKTLKWKNHQVKNSDRTGAGEMGVPALQGWNHVSKGSLFNPIMSKSVFVEDIHQQIRSWHFLFKEPSTNKSENPAVCLKGPARPINKLMKR